MRLPRIWPRRADPHAAMSLTEWAEMFQFLGQTYGAFPNQTLVGAREEMPASWSGYVEGAYKGDGVVFACLNARMSLFSEARFRFQRMRDGRPGDLWGAQTNATLRVLEEPWPGATTGDMLSRFLQDADLAGNGYFALRPGEERGSRSLRRLRPDWVTIVAGGPEATGAELGPDVELVGYLYHPGGRAARRDPIALLPEEVVHFAPIPDPAFRFRGMSWITPVLLEIMGDKAASTHKLRFFENGATPNMIVSLDPLVKPEEFDKWVAAFEANQKGLVDAYKTLYFGGGAQAQVVGANLRQLDFKITQGAGETRIAAAAGVPPIIVGLSEGLEAATYSNYGQARRRFADGTIRPLWRNLAGSLSRVLDVPADSRLWYDDHDIPFLQEDVADAANARFVEAQTMGELITAGFTPESVVDAVTAGDLKRLKHSGLVSVQLQPPGKLPVTPSNGNGNGNGSDPALIGAGENGGE